MYPQNQQNPGTPTNPQEPPVSPEPPMQPMEQMQPMQPEAQQPIFAQPAQQQPVSPQQPMYNETVTVQIDPRDNVSTKERIAKLFNLSGGATKKEFLYGMATCIGAAIALGIFAFLFSLIATSIASTKDEPKQSSLQRPEYVLRSDFTENVKRPLSTDYTGGIRSAEYKAALEAYNVKYKEATSKYEEATATYKSDVEKYQADLAAEKKDQQARQNVRDGFASIFSTIAQYTLVIGLVWLSAASASLTMRRLHDAGVTTGWIAFAYLAPIVIMMLFDIASVFILGGSVLAAILSVALFGGSLASVGALAVSAAIASLVIAVTTLIICLVRPTSVDRKTYLGALLGR